MTTAARSTPSAVTVPVTRGLAEPGRIPPLRKLGLVVEVLAVYVPALRALGRNDLRRMVATARREWPHGREAPHGTLETARTAARLGRVVDKTLRLLPTDTRCLMRSVVLTRLLARRGIESTLIVAARTEPDFAAHAWVEHAGRPLLDPGGPAHQRLIEL